jgi:hypothetical protein
MRMLAPMPSSITRMLRNGGDGAMHKPLRSSGKETARRPLPEVATGSVHAEDPTTATGLEAELAERKRLSLDDLRVRWRNNWGRLAPTSLSRGLLFRVMAYRLQAEAFGDLDRKTVRLLEQWQIVQWQKWLPALQRRPAPMSAWNLGSRRLEQPASR